MSESEADEMKIEVKGYVNIHLAGIIRADAEARNLPISEVVAEALARAYERPDLAYVPRKRMGRPARPLDVPPTPPPPTGTPKGKPLDQLTDADRLALRVDDPRKTGFHKAALKNRGWTDSLIKELLGEADAIRVRGRAEGNVRYFARHRVEEAERSERFIAKRKKGKGA
jgi:hypothetical protein